VAASGKRELTIVLLGLGALAVLFTFPLAFHLGRLGRIDNGDGQFSIWNVAWVARALVLDPLHVFDANIFYPHRGTLTYSEANLGAGAVAVPVYWATRNPYAAHNFVLLVSFVASGAGMYYLVRYLVFDGRAAAVAAISFAFCPYVLAHTPHIQLMMTAGLPFAMLALHRLVDRPTPTRGALLGLTMTAQAFFCGYYAIFVGLMVGFAAAVLGSSRRLWKTRAFWSALIAAALVAIASALPLVVPYSTHLWATGYTRSLESAREFSASWKDYFASAAYLHTPLLRMAGHRPTADMLFPGFVALGLGSAGAAIGWRAGGRLKETAIVYVSLALLAVWLSFGPAAGFYRALYAVVPGFTFLRAPSRFGLVVVFALSALAGIALAAWLARTKRPALGTAIVAAVAIAELTAPLEFPPVRPADEGYRVLASLPAGPLLELPVYSRQFGFVRASYMLNSTVHWMPLIDAYSDYIPDDFTAHMEALSEFPSREAFAVLEPIHARYAIFHTDVYTPEARAALIHRLTEFAPYLRERYRGESMWVYEIVEYPR
jgi:hypothetical protein